MLTLPAAPYRPSSRPASARDRLRRPPNPPAALTLVAASFNDSAPYVQLTFDRAVSIAGPLTLSAITVDDNVHTDNAFAGTGAATLVNPTTVQVPLVVTGGAHGGSLTLLSAAADTGIVAVDDGGTWAGASAVALPFG